MEMENKRSVYERLDCWLSEEKDTRRKLRKTFKDVVKTFADNGVQNERQELKAVIESSENGSELSEILNHCKINAEAMEIIYARINTCLQQELSKVGSFEITPFGSCASGLALRSSDFDIYIKDLDIRFDTTRIYNKILRSLYKSVCFTSIAPIRHARVPIIRCIHSPTGFSLDINVSCSTSVHKTKFVRDLVESDERIYELMLFLKIWARNLQIMGRGNITSYCLMTLIFFYLQNTKMPQKILSSFKRMQLKTQPCIVNGVNYAACLKNNIHPIAKHFGTCDLIKGFFKFYHNYDFENNIIAPYLGITISRIDFISGISYIDYDRQCASVLKATGEEPFPLNVESSMCVQDPFCLNINITGTISPANFQYFRTCLRHANNIITDSSIHSAKQFYDLLLFGITDKIAIEIDPPAPSIPINAIFKPSRDDLRFISQSYEETDKRTIFKLWSDNYIELLSQLITDVYKLEITKTTPTHKGDYDWLNTSVSSTIWALSGSVDLWTERDRPKQNDKTYLEIQKALTDELFEKRRQKSTFAVILRGYLTISRNEETEEIEISISKHADDGPLTKKGPLCKLFRTLKCDLQNSKIKDQLLKSKNTVQLSQNISTNKLGIVQ